MRKLVSVSALIVFATALSAASPWIGTWKLNHTESKYTSTALPKDETIVIEQQGDDFQTTVSGTFADGSPISLKYTLPKQGGTGEMQEGPFDSVSSKLVNSHTREVTYKKAGKVMRSSHSNVSEDGKILRVKVTGADLEGKPVGGLLVFNKQ
ncbi:MAG: hypothetical protein ACJ74Z_15440 [Bryobacteraceae bacterium]